VRSGRVTAWRKLAGTALVTWFAVSLPWLVMNADTLLSVYRSWWRAGATAEIRRLYPDVMVIGFTAHGAGGTERLLRAGAVSVIEKTSFPRLMDLILNLRNNAAS